MKAAAIIMAVILIASVLGVGWYYITSGVSVAAASIVSAEASAQPEYFEQLTMQINESAAPGIVHTASIENDPSRYKFVTYSVTLKNTTFLDAALVSLQVVSREGDVLQIGTDQVCSLPAQGTASFDVTVLTRTESYPSRQIIVTYYLWGQPFSLRTVVNN